LIRDFNGGGNDQGHGKGADANFTSLQVTPGSLSGISEGRADAEDDNEDQKGKRGVPSHGNYLRNVAPKEEQLVMRSDAVEGASGGQRTIGRPTGAGYGVLP
jgi:hypothetical protein